MDTHTQTLTITGSKRAVGAFEAALLAYALSTGIGVESYVSGVSHGLLGVRVTYTVELETETTEDMKRAVRDLSRLAGA